MKDSILIVIYKTNNISKTMIIDLENNLDTDINFNKRINLKTKEVQLNNYKEFMDIIQKSIYLEENNNNFSIESVKKKIFIY
jgi:hypothetical protein